MRRRAPAATAPEGRVRIIGGAWRGRNIQFPAAEGLRPTPDRIRETLFNWLQPHVEGARCLDLFCGSGALGLEALSRGARHVRFVDDSAAVIEGLRRNIERLGATTAECLRADALASLRTAAPGDGFDIVFVDPPYRRGLADRCIAELAAASQLAARALVYVESAVDEPAPVAPTGWVLHRDRHAGQVAYRLFIAQQPAPIA